MITKLLSLLISVTVISAWTIRFKLSSIFRGGEAENMVLRQKTFKLIKIQQHYVKNDFLRAWCCLVSSLNLSLIHI